MPRPADPVVRAARDRLQGLVPPSGALQSIRAPGWVPRAPEPGPAVGPEEQFSPDVPPGPGTVKGFGTDPEVDAGTAPQAGDVRDVVARMRAGALGTAATVYAARYGHPLEHPSPDAPSGARRWALGLRLAAVAAIAVAVLGAGVVARATLTSPAAPVTAEPQPRASSVEAVPGGGSVPGRSAVPGAVPGAGDQSGADVVAHVVGQVLAPGVVRLAPGSRVVDAIQAAGGAAPAADLAGINLARVVVDGEQVVVPAPGEAAPAAVTGGAIGAVPGRDAEPLVDLNSADLAALDALPGIGPVLAQRIVDWRTEHGRFTAVEELGEVAGIGDALFGRLHGLVRV
ncbi:helix-hairpin-helix domain-containing protein [Pengzhenrongella phosphoraccumulans]|uniref:ComEA family DNA-binding protein n=1 Tax=Pengzhenrongella phosphoraccumulans TaxID=3114394 RepID=UPI0038902786